MGLDDGRYLERRKDSQRVLVVETEGALPPGRRKRRQPRRAGTPAGTPAGPDSLPLTVVTVVFASEPLDAGYAADEWLTGMDDEERTETVLEEGLATLNRALAAEAAASGRALDAPVTVDAPITARIGFGDGDQVAAGLHLEAVEIDIRGGTATPRRRRLNQGVPLARIAAILGDSAPLLACEVLVPRVRADLDAGRDVAAALTVEAAVRATLIELEFSLDSPEHEADLDRIEELLPGLAGLADTALDPAPSEPVPGRVTDPGAETAPGSETGAGDGTAPSGATDPDREPEMDGRGRTEVALKVAERILRRYRISSQ